MEVLDSQKDSLEFINYAISETTLEDVFLHFDQEKMVELSKNSNLSVHSENFNETYSAESNAKSFNYIHFSPFFHIYTMLLKRAFWTFHDWKIVAFELILPLFVLIIAVYLSTANPCVL